MVNGNTSKAYTYDSYGRLSQQSTSVSGSPILTESFSYYTGTGGTSGQLRQYASTYGDGSLSYTYTYDDNGNIATVSDGTNTTRYIYDSQNQLIREYNQAAGKIWTWKYDDAGNLTHHREYEYSDTNMTTPLYTMRYTYGDASWGDLLTAYNGVAITYDGIGNPLNDGTWTYTWEHGRQMASMSNGTATWDMTYNADGLRTGRTNGSNTYTYWYNESGQLVRMKFNSLIFRIAYGASGQPVSISYNGNTYYYVLNQQGDVMALLDSSGNWVVKYTYDAWGNIISTTASTEAMRLTLAKYNPLRYRGYVYDRETGLYYLQSRYYNPEWGRFINADGLVSTGQGLLGNNMFAYGLNNHVNLVDPDGRCSRFLGFLWKVDCNKAHCSKSRNYVKPKGINPIGTYNHGQGYVYVVTNEQFNSIAFDEENVVVIIDQRTNADPNMQVRNSFRITETDHQIQIALLMLAYNKANPVNPGWSRTLSSIYTEWKFHNLAYYLYYKRYRTADCDFNNADEGKGFLDFFGR